VYSHLVEDRKNFKIVGKYYNKFLDDMLLGILAEDFVLIGSDTGVGKSEFAYSIAFENSIDKKVHLFALEADHNEPYYRKLYKLIAEEYYANPPYSKLDMSYRNYITNSIDVSEYEKKALVKMEEYYKLKVHYRGIKFDINDLILEINKIVKGDGCDLIVLDHIDYFDLNHAENENMQVAQIMNTLRQVNQTYKIPIIVISHMRKKGNKKQLIPTVDDFFGTSNKVKQVKTIITMARDFELTNIKAGEYGTLFQVPKLRVGGGEYFVGRIIYDRKKNAYHNSYELCTLKNYGETLELLERSKYPEWANQTLQTNLSLI